MNDPGKIAQNLVLIVFAVSALAFAQEKPEPEDQLYTNAYTVAPRFLKPGEAEGDELFPKIEGMSAQEFFESKGVKFEGGASIFFGGAGGSQMIVRNTEAEMAKIEAIIDQIRRENLPRMLTVIQERIEVDAAAFAEWRFENKATDTGDPLRRLVQRWVKAGEAKILETTVVTTQSGRPAESKSGRLILFPFEPTEPGGSIVPATVNLSGENIQAPKREGTPSNFEEREIGTTLEIDSKRNHKENSVDLHVTLEFVKNGDLITWPPEQDGGAEGDISFPKFKTEKITTALTVPAGKYAFLGSSKFDDPERRDRLALNFVRVDVAVRQPLED